MLWESTPDDPSQIRARQEVLNSTLAVLEQLELWTEAAKEFKQPKPQPMEEDEGTDENSDEDVEMSMNTEY